MCGISAIFQDPQTKFHEQLPTDLRRMASVLAHRGPDDSGYALLRNGTLGFAHNRLSFIDLRSGDQPLFNAEGTLCILFNGELYDYALHAAALERQGYHFQTRSDTEVLLALYETRGLKMFDALNGEFAFVLWDSRNDLIIAARDRAGVKPLYYMPADNGRRVVFASEAKAILALPSTEKRFNAAYFAGPFFGVFNPSVSLFHGIQGLKPGHYLTIERGRCGSETPYWNLDLESAPISFEEAAQGVRDRLTRAVHRRMVADVPVGAYLSGGLDSTLVCGLMATSGTKVRAFNIGFGGSEFDESPLARRIADHFGATFDTLNTSMADLASHLVRALYHIEMPLANPNAVAKFLLSRLVHASGYKVCLTGEGEDEVFGGYPYFKMEAIRRAHFNRSEEIDTRLLWKRFRRAEARSEGTLWDRRWGPGTRGDEIMPALRAREASRHFVEVFNLEGLGLPAERSPAVLFAEQFPPERLSQLDSFNQLRTVSWNQLAGYIIPTLGDRVEMAHSVECRTPFLDTELVEFAARLPSSYFIDLKRLREKHVLREAFADLLPGFLAEERKHPFLSPSWARLTATRAGTELAGTFLGSKAIEHAGIFRPGLVSRVAWLSRLLPARSPLARRVDVLRGLILSTQILHFLFVENVIASDPDFQMVDRTSRDHGRRRSILRRST